MKTMRIDIAAKTIAQNNNLQLEVIENFAGCSYGYKEYMFKKDGKEVGCLAKVRETSFERLLAADNKWCATHYSDNDTEELYCSSFKSAEEFILNGGDED